MSTTDPNCPLCHDESPDQKTIRCYAGPMNARIGFTALLLLAGAATAGAERIAESLAAVR